MTQAGLAAVMLAAMAGFIFGEEAATNAAPKGGPCGCGLLSPGPGSGSPVSTNEMSSDALLVYCSGAVKDPIQTIAKVFTTETQVEVKLIAGNTGQLLAQIEATKMGDVFLAGDSAFAAKAREKRLAVGEVRPFCYFVPALYVRKGNPKGIRDLADLAKPGLKLALADPSVPVGSIQIELFQTNRVDLAALKKNAVFSPAGVSDVVMAVKSGSADAGIVWDIFADYAPGDAEIVRIPPEKNVIAVACATVLDSSKDFKAAWAFVDFVVSEKARAILKAKGFAVDRP